MVFESELKYEEGGKRRRERGDGGLKEKGEKEHKGLASQVSLQGDRKGRVC